MSRLTLILLIALGGCAGLSRERLPVCDGGVRRPANPHGSVLSPAGIPPATEPAPAAGSAPADGGCA